MTQWWNGQTSKRDGPLTSTFHLWSALLFAEVFLLLSCDLPSCSFTCWCWFCTLGREKRVNPPSLQQPFTYILTEKMLDVGERALWTYRWRWKCLLLFLLPSLLLSYYPLTQILSPWLHALISPFILHGTIFFWTSSVFLETLGVGVSSGMFPSMYVRHSFVSLPSSTLLLLPL